jgi:prepilin-type N-terminal cleavage/methylation domain-containing protein
MNRTQKGFTLIELMIVIAIIAIIAAIAIPNLLSARLASNETAAIATLRQIIASESQFQQGARVDEDIDGVGEYGGFIDMSGGVVHRVGPVNASPTQTLVPSVLNQSFQTLNANGEATRTGYFFKVFLPTAAMAPVGEPGGVGPAAGFISSLADADARETTWCCYGWPANYNQTGNRTFFTHQGGDILQCEAAGLSGTGAIVTGDEAFPNAGSMTGLPDVGGPGQVAAPIVANWTVVSQ